jgi:hypothetical protein
MSMRTEWARTKVAAWAGATFGLAGCSGVSSPTAAPSLQDGAFASDARTSGGKSANEGEAEDTGAPPGNETPGDGAGVGAETGFLSQDQLPGQAADGSSAGSAGGSAPQMCGAGERAAVSSGLPQACAACLCSACPKEFGTPTGKDDPAIAGDVEAGLELPGGSNAQGCDTNCWLFWSCMYMNGCAELNAFDVSSITKCLTSYCGSQYAAMGGKWPNDTDLCSVEHARAGEQRACSAQCRGD